MATIATLVVDVLADVSSLNRNLTKAGGSLDKFGAKASKIGSNMTRFITLPMLAIGGASIKMSIDFNAAMADVATLIPQSTERVNELKIAVQQMAIAHGKSTQDLARGLYQTISAFGDEAGQTIKILEINSKAATAGMATTEQAIALTSAVTKAYGDTTAEAVQKASDLAFLTVKLGQTTFPELAAAMGKATPMASALGISQEELAATFATLTGVTGTASEVAASFSASLTALLKTTPAMRSAIGELGFATAKSMIATLGMKGAFDALIGTTDGTQEAMVKLFGRMEGVKAVMTLTSSQSDVFEEKLVAMTNAAGATDEAFREVTQGVNAAGFAWKQMTSALTVAGQKIGDELAPILLDLFETLKPLGKAFLGMLGFFADLPKPVKIFAISIGALLAALGPMLFIVGQVASALVAFGVSASTISGVLSAVGAALLALGGPITLTIAAVVAMIAIWVKFGDDIKAIVSGAVGKVIDAFQWLFDRVVGNSIIPEMVDKIGLNISRLDQLLVDRVAEQTAAVAQSYAGMADIAVGSINRIIGAASSLVPRAATTAGEGGFIDTAENISRAFLSRRAQGVTPAQQDQARLHHAAAAIAATTAANPFPAAAINISFNTLVSDARTNQLMARLVSDAVTRALRSRGVRLQTT